MSQFCYVGKGRVKVYDFIGKLIDDGEHAQFVNSEGRYSLNWPVAVEKYQELQPQVRRNSEQEAKTLDHGEQEANTLDHGEKEAKTLDHGEKEAKAIKRDASNKLRSALLNYYSEDGAVEYLEAQKKNSEGQIIHREFQMPKKVFKKFKKKGDTSSDDSIFQVQFIREVNVCHVFSCSVQSGDWSKYSLHLLSQFSCKSWSQSKKLRA